MSNEPPYGNQDPQAGHEWNQEPPAPPATWSPYGSPAPAYTGHEDTRPLAGSTPGDGPVLPPDRPQGRARGTLAASVIAASLLLGGAAGVGGAAIWTSTHDAPAESSPVLTQTGGSTAQTAATGSIEKVAQNVLPSVVMIEVSGPGGSGSGSGIILSGDGKILTNNHVVALAGKSGSLTVSFNDGSHAKAHLLGADPLTDTAVIQAEGVSGLTPATLGHSSSLQVGQSVVAIGSPFGLDATVTSGIVSALDRPVDVGTVSQGNATVYPAIQTDAAINPGNSGGPLVDANGFVIGVDSAIATLSGSQAFDGGQGGSIGLGFAIPIDQAKRISKQIIEQGYSTHAIIGVTLEPQFTGDGARIGNPRGQPAVVPGGPAAKAGLEDGDVVVKVDGQIVTTANELIIAIRKHVPGDRLTLVYVRHGSRHSTVVTLGSARSD
jgi:putative serine protease PepD